MNFFNDFKNYNYIKMGDWSKVYNEPDCYHLLKFCL